MVIAPPGDSRSAPKWASVPVALRSGWLGVGRPFGLPSDLALSTYLHLRTPANCRTLLSMPRETGGDERRSHLRDFPMNGGPMHPELVCDLAGRVVGKKETDLSLPGRQPVDHLRQVEGQIHSTLLTELSLARIVKDGGSVAGHRSWLRAVFATARPGLELAGGVLVESIQSAGNKGVAARAGRIEARACLHQLEGHVLSQILGVFGGEPERLGQPVGPEPDPFEGVLVKDFAGGASRRLAWGHHG